MNNHQLNKKIINPITNKELWQQVLNFVTSDNNNFNYKRLSIFFKNFNKKMSIIKNKSIINYKKIENFQNNNYEIKEKYFNFEINKKKKKNKSIDIQYNIINHKNKKTEDNEEYFSLSEKSENNCTLPNSIIKKFSYEKNKKQYYDILLILFEEFCKKVVFDKKIKFLRNKSNEINNKKLNKLYTISFEDFIYKKIISNQLNNKTIYIPNFLKKNFIPKNFESLKKEKKVKFQNIDSIYLKDKDLYYLIQINKNNFKNFFKNNNDLSTKDNQKTYKYKKKKSKNTRVRFKQSRYSFLREEKNNKIYLKLNCINFNNEIETPIVRKKFRDFTKFNNSIKINRKLNTFEIKSANEFNTKSNILISSKKNIIFKSKKSENININNKKRINKKSITKLSLKENLKEIYKLKNINKFVLKRKIGNRVIFKSNDNLKKRK